MIRKKELEKQGYRIVGNHSAIKICLYCKRCLRGEDVCYKNKFYGINSNQCVQMSPVIDTCSLRCQWCWRDVDNTSTELKGKIDSPSEIIEGCIKAQREILQGFKGNKKTDIKNFEEAMNPQHFAISLTGEVTYYPLLPELIKELGKRNMTSFVVTNGTNPSMIKKLIKTPLTQLYITLPAPNEKVFKEVCRPLIKNAWKNIQESLSLLKHFKRSTIRLTLVKDYNMLDPEGYAELIEKANPKFLEVKAGMAVGYARYRLKYTQMPLSKEIREFSEKLAKLCNLKIVDEKKESRVCLLMKEDKDRKINLHHPSNPA
tara:strand:- start:2643 stop:3590 length:948 start_codon:yes stop_codon:yes gene_type:complete